MGTAVAVHEGGTRLWPGLGALVVALALQVGTNYANDYSDFRRGADTSRRLGPVRASASGLVRPGAVRSAALAAFAVAAAAGLAVSLATDWRLLLAGVACVLAGWLYTGGPRPYGYLGLGELFVFVFFGLVAAGGTAYVNQLRLSPLAALAGVAAGCLACAILALNNLRDLDTDASAGKRTLAVRLGRPRTRGLIAAFFGAAFLVPIAAALAAGWPALLPLLSAPLALAPLRATRETAGPPLVAALRRTAELEAVYALLWALGLVL